MESPLAPHRHSPQRNRRPETDRREPRHVPGGKESFTYHSHHREEEWIYILSGQAIAEIDGAEYEVGPGDFMAFPTPSVAHHLRNPCPLTMLSSGPGGELHMRGLMPFRL
ncbi:MAG: cupin domain-containing protein [bacterium]